MTDADPSRGARLLARASSGDPPAAAELQQAVYDELRQLAGRAFAGQAAGHTLEPTVLVHEAYLRMIGRDQSDWKSHTHFCAVAAKAMRQILVDHHRRGQAEKRGADWQRVTLDPSGMLQAGIGIDAMALEEALHELRRLDERQCRVVELRFFAGLEVAEVAAALGVSVSTVEAEWRHARAWLRRQLHHSDSTPSD